MAVGEGAAAVAPAAEAVLLKAVLLTWFDRGYLRRAEACSVAAAAAPL
jgi:hypothetical protein